MVSTDLQERTRNKRIGFFLVGGLGLFMLWYVLATGYSYSELSGSYYLHRENLKCKLILHGDGSFDEVLETLAGQKVQGRWRRIGEGTALFYGLIGVPKAQTDRDGAVVVDFDRTFGVLPTLTMRPNEVHLRFVRLPF